MIIAAACTAEKEKAHSKAAEGNEEAMFAAECAAVVRRAVRIGAAWKAAAGEAAVMFVSQARLQQ